MPDDPLSRKCPRCGREKGQRCVNYLGKNKQSCPERLGRPRARPVPGRALVQRELFAEAKGD